MAANRICAVLVVLMFLCGSAGMAQTDILDSLIRIGLEHNPELKASRYSYQASEAAANAAGVLPDPGVSIAWSNVPRSSLALDETPMSGVSLGLTQKIPWPGKLNAGSKAANLRRDRALTSTDLLANTLIRDIKTAYFDYAYWVEARKKIVETHELAEAMEEVAATRYGNGEVTAQDLLRAQSNKSRLNIRLLDADRNRESNLYRLERLIGDTMLVASVPATLDDVSLFDMAEADGDDHPLLERAAVDISLAEASLSLARANYWPDITLGIDYRLREKVPGDPVAGEDWLSFKVGFSVPLWFFARQNNESRASAHALDAARAREVSIRDNLTEKRRRIRETMLTLQESIETYDSAIIPQSRAAYETARTAYEVGRIDFNALLAAQMNLLTVELERLDLLRRINIAAADREELYAQQNYR